MADTIQFHWNQNITLRDACVKIDADLGATPGSLEKAITKLREQEKNVNNQMIYGIIYDMSRDYQVVVLSFQISIKQGKAVTKKVKQHWFFNPFGPTWRHAKKETSTDTCQMA